MSVFSRTVLATALLAAAPLASATDVGTTFDVKIEIVNNCLITATDMDFTTGSLDQDTDATATVTVDCSSTGESFTVALNGGSSGDIAAREMTGPGGAVIEYDLYTDAGRTQTWGDGTVGVTQGDITTDADRTFTVYGRVPAQAAKPVGNYADQVTATVTF